MDTLEKFPINCLYNFSICGEIVVVVQSMCFRGLLILCQGHVLDLSLIETMLVWESLVLPTADFPSTYPKSTSQRVTMSSHLVEEVNSLKLRCLLICHMINLCVYFTSIAYIKLNIKVCNKENIICHANDYDKRNKKTH